MTGRALVSEIIIFDVAPFFPQLLSMWSRFLESVIDFIKEDYIDDLQK